MASDRALELARRIWKWQPHSEGQYQWMRSEAKVKIAACGRRWGKSESTALDIVLYALEHPNTSQIIVAPTADQTTIMMDEVERRFYSIPGFEVGVDFDHRRSPYNEITFKDGLSGAANAQNLTLPTQIMARTAGTSGRGLRGRKAHRVVVDEAAFISEKIMMNVITPLLADYDGQRVEVSSPDGLNHFYDDFQRGQDDQYPDYESFQFPTSSNPYIPEDYLAREKLVKPEAAYLQEYEAAFRSGEGTIFRKVHEALGRARAQERAIRGHQYLFTVDWGQSNDFTVIAVVDLGSRELVHLERFNEISWRIQRARLIALFERFLPINIVVEANSIGGPNIEALQDEGLPVIPFWTTNTTKRTIVNELVLALERGNFALLDDPNIKNELLSFAGKRSPIAGTMTYSAPEGKHDDIVIALCLAAWAMNDVSIVFPSGSAAVPSAPGGIASYKPR